MKHIRQGKSDGWVILYYLGLLLFLLSFALAAFIPRVAFYAELLAFACLLIFLVGRMIVPIIRNGWSLEKVLELVSGFRNRSFLVASLFFCMALYGLAVRAGALPPLYADAYPEVFFDMSGTGEIMEGGSRAASSPAQFKDAYERFVSRHLEGDPQ